MDNYDYLSMFPPEIYPKLYSKHKKNDQKSQQFFFDIRDKEILKDAPIELQKQRSKTESHEVTRKSSPRDRSSTSISKAVKDMKSIVKTAAVSKDQKNDKNDKSVTESLNVRSRSSSMAAMSVSK